jgi:CelD/BcsL family acetyltransferase involved in cellulose biosynthesis
VQPSTSASASELSARIVRSAADLFRLNECWTTLAEQSPSLTPWQEWDFISTWLRAASTSPGPPFQMRVVLVERGQQPCLIVPLQLSHRGRTGMRWLEPIGMPDNIHRPRFGLGPLNRDAYAVALRTIEGLWGEADGLRIDEKTTDDAELALLRSLATPLGWKFRASPLHPCPYLSVPDSWSHYLGSRSPKLRKNLNNSRRRLAAHGPLRLVRFDSKSEILQAFDLLLDITSRSWKATEKIGLGASDHYRAFYKEFVARMAEKDCARVYCLFAGPQAIAATLAFVRGDTYYATQIAHDSQFDECSPGTLLESMELEALIGEGRFKTYDFLGAALANKRRWTDTMHATDRVVWLGRTQRALLFDIVYFRIKPFVVSALKILRRRSS